MSFGKNNEPSNRIKPCSRFCWSMAYLADGSEFRGNYGLTQEELVNFHRKNAGFN